MNRKLTDLLQDFAYNLQEISPRPIKDMEIVLPYDNYRQLEHELRDMGFGMSKSINLYEVPSGNIDLQTTSGIRFKCTCKEIKDAMLQNKLHECFKILSK